MKIKTAELLGPPLDWAVAKAEGLLDHITFNHEMTHPLVLSKVQVYGPSIFPAQGWPIIDREGISVVCCEGDWSHKTGYSKFWIADIGKQCTSEVYGSQGDHYGTSYTIDEGAMRGPTSLIAAMRCFVASKLGDEVDVPEELVS